MPVPSMYREMDDKDAVSSFASTTANIPRRIATMTNDVMGRENNYGTSEDVVERQQDYTNVQKVKNIPDEPEGKWCHWPTLVAYVGPGFLVCIAYLDPGNLEADLQTGAYTGYQLLWVLLSAHIMGLVLQSLAARLGVVTGKHLAEVCRERYPRIITWLLWAMTESAIIGSDIQEVVGSAIGLQILLGIPLWVGCLLTALDTFTFLFIHIFGVRKLEGLFVFLVSVMTVSFFVEFFMSPPTAGEILEGFTFTAESYATVTALGLIGAVIMPHNIYLHSALVLSRDIDRTNKRKLWEATKYYTIDSGTALFVAFFINLAVVCTFAKQFYDEKCATASTTSACLVGESIDYSQPTYGTCDDGEGVCQEIGLSSAAAALEGSLGKAAKYVWAVGLLAAGQSSTMTGTYAGQFVMGGFLKLEILQWQRVLLTRVIALGPALAVTVAMGNDIRATDRLSAWLNVLQCLQLPFAVIPLLTFCASKELMGEFAIKPAMTVFVWILALGIIIVNVYIVGDFVEEEANESERADLMYAFSGIIMTLYLMLIAAVVCQAMPPSWQEAISANFDMDRFRSCHPEGCSRIGNNVLTETLGLGECDMQPFGPGLGEGSSDPRWHQFAPSADPCDEEREVAGGENRGRGEEWKSERRVFSLSQEHEAR